MPSSTQVPSWNARKTPPTTPNTSKVNSAHSVSPIPPIPALTLRQIAIRFGPAKLTRCFGHTLVGSPTRFARTAVGFGHVSQLLLAVEPVEDPLGAAVVVVVVVVAMLKLF